MADLAAKKKQRNYLLDFWKLFWALSVLTAHFMQWFGNAGSVGTEGAYFFTCFKENDFIFKGIYCLGFYTFTTGYWFIDHFKKQQRMGVIGKGKDIEVLWKYWAKNYSSYMPYIFVVSIATTVLSWICLKAPLESCLKSFVASIPGTLGFASAGFTELTSTATWLTKWMADPNWLPDIIPTAPGFQLWYMSCLICCGVSLMAMFVISEKFSLFVIGPTLITVFMKENWNWTARQASGNVHWDFFRLFGPAFIGIYAWYLVDYLKKAGISEKMRKVLNVGHAITLIVLLVWMFFWEEVSLYQSDTIAIFTALFAIINGDAIAQGLNKFFNKTEVISKHFQQVGLGAFLCHSIVLIAFKFYDLSGSIPWYTNMNLMQKYGVILLVCGVCSIILFPLIDKYICQRMTRFLVELTGCRKPVIIDEPEKAEVK